MRVQDLISSKPMTRFGIFLGQHTPRWVGYGLSRIVAGIISRRKPQIYRTVQENLRQVIGSSTTSEQLHEMVRHVFYHAGQTYYDFFNTINRPMKVLAEAVYIPEHFIEQIKALTAQGQGVLLLATHMSNFDLAGLSVGARGLPIQMLSLANPEAGFHLLNYLRAKGGFEVTPITPESLRTAIRRLKSGGIVLTGMDRPIPEDQELIEFFDRPAYLPVGPMRLALMTDAVVFVGSCYHTPNQGYTLDVRGPIEMVRTGNRRQDILTNTQRLAGLLEEFVSAHPDQWMMFHPFWPDMEQN